MVESYLTAPTFTLNYEVDMTEMLALRKKVLEPIMEATGKKTTVTDLLSLAVVKTLMKHPYINASLTEDGKTIITHNYVNLAMAVGMDNGLMTPVVYNAEKMSLSELVVAFKDVIGRTLDGKLAPSELQNQHSQSVTWECLVFNHSVQSLTNRTQQSLGLAQQLRNLL